MVIGWHCRARERDPEIRSTSFPGRVPPTNGPDMHRAVPALDGDTKRITRPNPRLQSPRRFLKQRLRLANASGGRDTFGRAIRNAIAHAPPSSIGKRNSSVASPTANGTSAFLKKSFGCPFLPLFSPVFASFIAVFAIPRTCGFNRRCSARLRLTSQKQSEGLRCPKYGW
jgi:hypothetical protein